MPVKPPTVGIIGRGFVGDAVAWGFASMTDVKAYDVDPKKCDAPFDKVAQQDVVFICVPTPTHQETGRADLTILRSVVEKMNVVQCSGNNVGAIVIKSTVPPRVVYDMAERYFMLQFVSNPEFLTERTARDDFVDPARIVIGEPSGGSVAADIVVDLYERLCPTVPIVFCTHNEAALIKYASNCFFAAKLSFFNELKQICDRTPARYDTVRQGVVDSGWVSPMHTSVPGPDGDVGFGGKCFPKDVQALAQYAHDLNIHPVMLMATLVKNDEVRSDRNWKSIDGATS